MQLLGLARGTFLLREGFWPRVGRKDSIQRLFLRERSATQTYHIQNDQWQSGFLVEGPKRQNFSETYEYASAVPLFLGKIQTRHLYMSDGSEKVLEKQVNRRASFRRAQNTKSALCDPLLGTSFSAKVALPTERESGGKTLEFPRGPPRPRTGAETHPPEADDAVPATPAVTLPVL